MALDRRPAPASKKRVRRKRCLARAGTKKSPSQAMPGQSRHIKGVRRKRCRARAGTKKESGASAVPGRGHKKKESVADLCL